MVEFQNVPNNKHNPRVPIAQHSKPHDRLIYCKKKNALALNTDEDLQLEASSTTCAMPLLPTELQRILNRQPVRKRPAGCIVLDTDSEPEDNRSLPKLSGPQASDPLCVVGWVGPRKVRNNIILYGWFVQERII